MVDCTCMMEKNALIPNSSYKVKNYISQES